MQSCRSLLSVVLVLTLSLLDCNAEDDIGPRILVSKNVLNRYLVENMDILVKYDIYNVGNSAAINVQLVEGGFESDSFDVVGGQLTMRVERLPPHTNISHVIVVRPLKWGYFNFTSAEVTYQSSDDLQTKQVTYSSEPGEGTIIAFKDFDKKFSSHVLDWVAFAIMTLPSLAIPFSLWYRSKNKYETLIKSRKNH